MANPYANQPYSTDPGFKTPEYNVRGDSANGQTGSYSPEAIQNRAQQAPQSPNSGGGNPYADILKFLPTSQARPTAVSSSGVGNGNFPDGDRPPPYTPPPSTSAPQVPPPSTGQPMNNPNAPGGTAPPPGGNPMQHNNPQTGEPAEGWGNVPKPLGTEDPEIAAQWYRTFGPQYQDVTAQDVGQYRNENKNLYQAIGFDQWWNLKQSQGNGQGQQGGGQGSGQAVDPNQEGADFWSKQLGKPVTPADVARFIASGQHGKMDFGSWFAGNPAPTDPNAQPGGKQGGQPPPPAPPDPNATPSPDPNATPSTNPSGNQSTTPPGGSSMQDIVNIMNALLGPQFKNEQTDLSRQMNAQAALRGDTNSMGYNEVFGRDMGRLIGQQGSRITDATTSAYAQQKQIDSTQFIAELQDATARFGIKTNDDLQRWLNDPNNNTLQKYGIDKNDLLRRYEAELQLQGVKLNANAQISAASLHAAAARAAADAQTAQAAQQAMMQYNLGLAGLGERQYEFNNPNINNLIQWYMSLSPEQMAQVGSNGFQFPSWLFTQPKP